jgi:hypothetical protein
MSFITVWRRGEIVDELTISLALHGLGFSNTAAD